MDKLPQRKRTTSLGSDVTTSALPPPPPSPKKLQFELHELQYVATPTAFTGRDIPNNNSKVSEKYNLSESIQLLSNYKVREKEFLKHLEENTTNDLKKEDSKSTSPLMCPNASVSTDANSLLKKITKTTIDHSNYSAKMSSLDSSFSTFSSPAASSCISNKMSSANEITTNEITMKSLRSNNCHQIPSAISSQINESSQQDSNGELLRKECEQFIMPLLNRSSSTITAMLATFDTFEQLTTLHKLIDQVLAIEEQNYQMKKYIRDVKMLCELKKLQHKDYSNDLLSETDLYDNELDLNNHGGLLNTILAAGNTASNKRSFSKRQQRERSKSVICDEVRKENMKMSSTLRRQSTCNTESNKAKISKWTKVKAAFKWEKTNVQSSEGETKLSIKQLKPINNEVARYLRVPAAIPITGSSADSILSSSIPPTPGTVSSASSIEDVKQALHERRDSSKSDSRYETKFSNVEEDNQRSRSLDSDMITSQISSTSLETTKTPWRKVKNIIQPHKESLKNKGNCSGVESTNRIGNDKRDVIHSELFLSNFEPSVDSEITTRTQKSNSTNILLPCNLSSTTNSKGNSGGVNNFGILPNSQHFVGDDEVRSKAPLAKSIRKSKVVSEFESLPEGVPVDITSSSHKIMKQPLASSLNSILKLDSSDAEFGDLFSSPLQKMSSKILSNRKYLTSAGNSSVPSSPSRHSEFFAEFESEDMSSGDFSEPTTPSQNLSDRLQYQIQQEEINEKYLELKEKLNKEFEVKRQEWEKMRVSCSSSSSSAYQLMQSNDLLQSNKNIPSKFLEESLSADFKKKLHKWRNKKPENTRVIIKNNSHSPSKSEKIDWNLWKTGQLKLEGQGLSPLPDQKSLPEEFQKKLEQWKKMKDTKTVSTYASDNQNPLRRSSGKFSIGIKSHEGTKKPKDENKIETKEKLRHERDKLYKNHDKEKLEKLSKLRAIVAEPKIKEIEVKTSAGVMKFEGISRKFTRKLYEWEKAKGIGPESSTFAFLYPGYNAVTIGSKSKEHQSHEPSPTIVRSLSLDSLSQMQALPMVSRLPSCLSLNDVNEFRDNESYNKNHNRRVSSNLDLCKKHLLDEILQECTDETEDNVMLAEMLNNEKSINHCLYDQKALKSNQKITIQELWKVVDILESIRNKPTDNICNALAVLTKLEKSIPELEEWLQILSKQGREAMTYVRNYVAELTVQCRELNQDQACCQELLDERRSSIEKNLHGLQKNIILVCKYAQIVPFESFTPKLNATSSKADIVNLSDKNHKTSTTNCQSNALPDQEVNEYSENQNCNTKNSYYVVDANIITRNSSNGSRKKTRLRKIGSRQNSKTESESTDDEAVNNNEVTQRRLKRRLSRNKRSLDEDKSDPNACEENVRANNTVFLKDKKNAEGEDVLYVLKIKPGQRIEQSEINNNQNESWAKGLISPTETSVQLMNSISQEGLNFDKQSVFVKTKRKIFTLVGKQPSEIEMDNSFTPAVISRDFDSSTTTEIPETEDSCKDSTSINSFPTSVGLKSCGSPVLIRKATLEFLECSKSVLIPPKEPSSSIKLMIDKYNQKLQSDKIGRSPLSSGTCTPASIHSPISERKLVRAQTNKYQENIDKVVKSSSAGCIIPNKSLKRFNIFSKNDTINELGRVSKSFSLENIFEISFLHGEHSFEVEPLAYDSLKNLKKSSETVCNVNSNNAQREHLFKKNKEKPSNLIVVKSGALRKIDMKQKSEQMWSRSSSISDKNEFLFEKFHNLPDKSDNTIPKITRKLENKAITPTEKSHPFSGELWHPLLPISNKHSLEHTERSKSNERAIKLARAKQEFLQEISSENPSQRNQFDICESDADWMKNRLSETSFGSEYAKENCSLLKCASVGMIVTTSNESTKETQQNENKFDELEHYVSLPRSIARSGKITSKLGFSTLASKFRKVKIKRDSRDETTSINKMGAVSALCRQSLVLDVTNATTPTTVIPKSEYFTNKQNTSRDTVTTEEKNVGLVKSKSSHVGTFGTLFKSKDKNKDRRKDQQENVLKSKSAILPYSSKNK